MPEVTTFSRGYKQAHGEEITSLQILVIIICLVLFIGQILVILRLLFIQ